MSMGAEINVPRPTVASSAKLPVGASSSWRKHNTVVPCVARLAWPRSSNRRAPSSANRSAVLHRIWHSWESLNQEANLSLMIHQRLSDLPDSLEKRFDNLPVFSSHRFQLS